MSISQMFFEFKDWKRCFETCEENLPIYGNEMCLIISVNPITSGYWIEEYDPITTDTINGKLYRGKEFEELKQRVILEHEQAKLYNRSPKLTL
jgi:hypothetical protein